MFDVFKILSLLLQGGNEVYKELGFCFMFPCEIAEGVESVFIFLNIVAFQHNIFGILRYEFTSGKSFFSARSEERHKIGEGF